MLCFIDPAPFVVSQTDAFSSTPDVSVARDAGSFVITIVSGYGVCSMHFARPLPRAFKCKTLRVPGFKPSTLGIPSRIRLPTGRLV